tara:strand:+ start:1895 stop:3217 length:1323 start_codon:yes stop_codon:yes gene_type:complete
MRLVYILITFISFLSCSFDNKTGIWKNETNITKKNSNLFKEFELITNSEQTFYKTIEYDKKVKIDVGSAKRNTFWKDIFYNKSNNSHNFTYKNLNNRIFESKKLSNHSLSDNILFFDNKLVSTDVKGNIIIYSLKSKKKTKYNFYQKKFKKIEKKLNLILDDNIIYISDNLGYLYAIDSNSSKILWAKNFKIPFRSNMKIFKNSLIAANQNNNLLFIDKRNGQILKDIPTEETLIKNTFLNNLSLNEKSLFYLNTFGSLYSIDLKTKKINWFINLNQSFELDPSNAFNGSQIVTNNNYLVVSSNKNFHILDTTSGYIKTKENFSVSVKPVILDDYVFLITKNDLLVAMKLSTGKFVYSYDINEQISQFLDIKRKKAEFKNINIINNNILIFLQNSYTLKYDITGELLDIIKLPSNINSFPIFVEDSIFYLNKKKRLLVVN